MWAWLSINAGVVAAIFAALAALLVSGITFLGNLKIAKVNAGLSESLTKMKAEMDNQAASRRAQMEQKIEMMRAIFQNDLANLKHLLEHKTELSAEKVVTELLLIMLSEQKTRTWNIIRATIGGFTDEELRKILVGAGAIRMTGPHGEERWGILSQNREFLIENRFLRRNRNPDWDNPPRT